MYNGARIAQSV